MSAPTLSDVRVILGRRLGPYVALADLGEATAWALREMGDTPSSNTSPSDADLAAVADADVNKLLDLCSFRAMGMMALNCDGDTLKQNGIFEDPERVEAKIRRRLEVLTSYVRSAYGVGLGPLTGGVIDLDFASQNDDPANAVPS